jgi:hypothetical protein
MPAVDYHKFAIRFAARKTRCGLMLKFLRNWNHPRKGAKLVPSAKIDRAEKRLGFALPAALKEWYWLPFNPFFLKPRLFWTRLVYPEHLEVWPEGAAKDGLIVFQQEYQLCCEWAFLVRDAHLPDPPIYYGNTEDELPLKKWKLQSSSLSGFFLELLMLRSVFYGRRFAVVKDRVNKATWKKVADGFTDLGFPVWLEYGKHCRLVGGEDCLLAIRPNPPWGREVDLYLGARTGRALDRVTDMLCVEWDCVEDPRKKKKRKP